jgi:hypothetical protein
MPVKQCKFWPFTWYLEEGTVHGWTPQAVTNAALKALEAVNEAAISEHLVYLVAQAELCPTSERLHVQGYLELKERWTFHRVQEKVFKVYMPTHVHCSAARGTSAQYREYCTKVESRVAGTEPVDVGDLVGDSGVTHQPGKALDRVFVDIRAGATMGDLIAKYGFSMWVNHNKSLEKAMMIWGKKRKAHPRVVLLIGPSGSGKSWYVGGVSRPLPLDVRERRLCLVDGRLQRRGRHRAVGVSRAVAT